MATYIFPHRKSHSITDDADNILKYYFKDQNVIYAKEHLGHDGYDRHGPESNLWDFDVLVEESNNKYIFYNYHYEDWFSHGGENYFDYGAQSSYELYSTDDLSKVDLQKKKQILSEILIYSKNEKLIKYYQDLNSESIC
jgi:hypothetical protein